MSHLGATILIALVAGCGGGGAETCTQMTSCPTGGGSYELCTTGEGSGATCRYKASDGTTFSCGSCGNCQAATMQVVGWCSGGGTGGNGGGGAGGGGGGSSNGGPAGCVSSTVCANSAKDCAAGQRCNTALNPPVCQALYCGADGTVCAGDDANDLCAARLCTAGYCGAPDLGLPADSCCAPGHPGNELGVGKACTSQNDCGGQQATFCSTLDGSANGFCLMQCTMGMSCGTNASCVCTSGSCACVPTACDTTGC